MKIIIATLNSKYTHTSLALRHIGNWIKRANFDAELAEYTINTPIYQIIGDLYRKSPDVLIFSVYIWNGAETRAIAAELKKLMPKVTIIFGGPEVSFDSKRELAENHDLDFITCGEGEQVTENLLKALEKDESERDYENIKSLTWRNGSDIVENPLEDPISMEKLIFPYPDLEQLTNRILYYESSRGCPYNCSYCLSSATKGVRFRSDEKFKQDLRQFIDAEVRQVKFIDRTFNANPDRALAMWKFLSDEDKGITNFHFEITAELLRTQDLEFLVTVRPGLFQFEIGIQTTLKEASEAVNRRLAFEQLQIPVKTLLEAGNIHIHVDLIAGLPFESYSRFLKSLDDVYGLNPQVLQLGFLKLIKGSQIRDQINDHAYIFENYQPYEILQNAYIKFEELLMLKDIEECLEHLHNSKRFGRSLKLVLNHYSAPSDFFERFSQWLRSQGHFNEAIKTDSWFELLWQFANDQHPLEKVLQALKTDLLIDYMSSMGKQAPAWLIEDSEQDLKTQIFDIVKRPDFIEKFPELAELSAEERVKKVRYAGVARNQKQWILLVGLSE